MTIEVNIQYRYRPCIYISENEKCLFHVWEHFSEPIAPTPFRGGHQGGQVSRLLGVIERPNGTLVRVLPKEIQFVDNELERVWEEQTTRSD